MRVLLSLMLVTAFTQTSSGQTAAPPKAHSVAELIQMMPKMIHANPRDNLAPFLHEVDTAFNADPSVINSLGPAFASDLSDPDPIVQASTLTLLYALTAQSGDPSLELSLVPQLLSGISSKDELVERAAMLALTNMREAAPDSLALATTKVLRDKSRNDELLLAAGATLMIIRPQDDAAQDAVIEVVNDPRRSSLLRNRMANDTANRNVGSKIVDNLVAIANTSPDRSLRDGALNAAERVGTRALLRVSATTQKIADDPTESDESKEIARSAREVLAHSAR